MAKTNKNIVVENHNGQAVDNNASKIDAIKQLIFGENMREYDTEFTAVKKDILNKKKELEGFIEDIRTELHKSIDNLSTDINIRVTELEDSLNDKIEGFEDKKLDKQLLGELLVNLGEKIKK